MSGGKVGISSRICQILGVSVAKIDQARDDDHDEGEHLGGREQVLHFGHRLHVVAVHRGQQAFKGMSSV